MKRYLIATALGVLALSQVNADNTGRVYIRTADTTPAAPAPAAPAPAAAPVVTMPSQVMSTGCATCAAAAPSDPRVGIHPLFRRLFWWKHSSCSACGKKCGGLFGPRCNSGPGFGHGHPEAFNPYPNGVPGTLVFPQHQFVRSPRDFWMWEAK